VPISNLGRIPALLKSIIYLSIVQLDELILATLHHDHLFSNSFQSDTHSTIAVLLVSSEGLYLWPTKINHDKIKFYFLIVSGMIKLQ